MKDDHQMVQSCKEIYLRNITVYPDSDEELKHNSKNGFKEFLKMNNSDLIKEIQEDSTFFKRLKSKITRNQLSKGSRSEIMIDKESITG